MQERNIRSVITEAFKERTILEDISDDTDFFDVGASSLTVVDLQIQIEGLLELTAETSDLMKYPTINGWVDVYSKVAQEAVA